MVVIEALKQRLNAGKEPGIVAYDGVLEYKAEGLRVCNFRNLFGSD
jgi:hypothetical protein